MPSIKDKQYLGSIIPNVYIRKITLETTSVETFERNPHIDDEREPDVVRNPTTGKLERDPLSSDLMRKSSEQPLKITLDLLMKETLDDTSMVATWFGNEDFMKYLKLKVVQSVDVDTTNNIAQRKIDLSLYNKSTNIKNILDIKIISIQHELKNRRVDTHEKIGDSILEQYISYIDENGKKVYDISLPVSFEIKNAEPKHLAYFVVPFLDVETMVNDYEMDVDTGRFKSIDGKINSDVVINDFKMVSQSFIFMDENGEVWNGSVFQIENGRWIEGDQKVENPRYVELKTVPNNKIQDFRDIKELERLQLDFTIVENNSIEQDIIFSGKDQAQSKKNYKTKTEEVLSLNKLNRPKPYFTDLYLTRDSDGNSRFLFGFEYLKFVKNETLFGKLYRDDNKELLENVRIRQMKIKRTRVKDLPNALVDLRGIAAFNEEESDIMIVISGEREVGKFEKGEMTNGSIREVVLDLEEKNSVRFFTGLDKHVSKETFGLYQYGVELEVEDNTSNFLVGLLDNLLQAHKILNFYFANGTQKENFDVVSNQFTIAFANKMDEIYKDNEEQAPWVFPISIYLETISILHMSFDQQRYAKSLFSYVHPRLGNPNGVTVVMSIIEKLASKISSVINVALNRIETSHILADRSDQNSISIIARSNVQKNSVHFEKYFAAKFNSEVDKNIGYDFLSNSGILEQEKTNDGLKVVSKVQFDKRTEMETTKFFASIDKDINLRTDIFAYTMNDNLERSRYAFLTPSNVNLGGIKASFIGQGRSFTNQSKTLDVSTSIMNFNNLRNSPQIPLFRPTIAKPNENTSLSIKQQVVKSNISAILGNIGLEPLNRIMLSASVEKNDQEQSELKEESTSVDSSKILGEVTFNKEGYSVAAAKQPDFSQNFMVNPTNVLLSLAGNKITDGLKSSIAYGKVDREAKSIINTIDNFNLKNPNNALDRKILSYTVPKDSELLKQDFAVASPERQMFVMELPNQIKSILAASVSSNVANRNWFVKEGDAEKLLDPLKDPSKQIEFKFNYNIINQVEVLTGFEKTEDDGLQIKVPIWKKLTKEIFNQSENKNLFCRLIEYENKDFGIKRPTSLDLPTYNRFFIISPDEKILDLPTIKYDKKFQMIGRTVLDLNAVQKIVFKPEFSSTLVTSKNINVPKFANVIGSTIKDDQFKIAEIKKDLADFKLDVNRISTISRTFNQTIKTAPATVNRTVPISLSANLMTKISALR